MDAIPELLKSITGTVVRRALTGLFIWLATRGWITESDYTELIGWVAAAVAILAWSIWQKIKAARLLEAALDLPAGSSLAKAKQEAAS